MEKKISLPSNGSGLFGNDLSLDLSLRLACMRLEDNFIHCFIERPNLVGH